MPRYSQITTTMSINMNNSERVGKLDRKDYLILNELLMNAEVTSFDIAKKLKMPLSTVQRRRTALEHSSLIRKSYQLDAKQFWLENCGYSNCR